MDEQVRALVTPAQWAVLLLCNDQRPEGLDAVEQLSLAELRGLRDTLERAYRDVGVAYIHQRLHDERHARLARTTERETQERTQKE